MQGDMLQCDKENRAFRQRSRERMTETRNRLLDVGKETDYTWAIPVKSRRRLSTNKKRRCIVYYDTPPSFFTPGSILGKTQRQNSTTGKRRVFVDRKYALYYDTNILPKISVKIHLLRYVLVVNYPLLQIALTGVNLFIGTLRLTYIKSVDFFHTFSTEFPHFSRFFPPWQRYFPKNKTATCSYTRLQQIRWLINA